MSVDYMMHLVQLSSHIFWYRHGHYTRLSEICAGFRDTELSITGSSADRRTHSGTTLAGRISWRVCHVLSNRISAVHPYSIKGNVRAV